MRIAIFCCIIVALLTAACATVPLTGRRQLSLVPDAEIMAASFRQYDQFLEEHTLSGDAQATAMIQRVGNNIKSAVEKYFADNGMNRQLDGYAWEFNLVESEDVNAWCMPGGKVVFYTGILPITQTETGVAVVMGHEVAHAVAEHGAERMSQQLVAQFGSAALATALQNKPKETQAMFMAAFGVGAQYGVLLPFSRTQESEADHLGLVFMAMAGYDPREAVAFWGRMSDASGGGKPPEMMSTHPSDATRIANLRELMPEAMRYYEGD